MIALRGGSGLGDALYVQSVARYFVECGQAVEVCSDYPDVFRPLWKKGVTVSPFRRDRVTKVAHYTFRKGEPGTSQFEDCCRSAGITTQIELRLDWRVTNQALVDRVRDAGKPVVLVQLPRNPMGRNDGVGAELLPDCGVIQRIIDRIRGDVLIVQVGKGPPRHRFTGVDIDLANQTTVAEMLDVASVASGFVGYVSFFVPLSESFSRPGLFVWSRAGLSSVHEFIRQITPQKVLHRRPFRFVFDDWTGDRIIGAADEFHQQVRGA